MAAMRWSPAQPGCACRERRWTRTPTSDTRSAWRFSCSVSRPVADASDVSDSGRRVRSAPDRESVKLTRSVARSGIAARATRRLINGVDPLWRVSSHHVGVGRSNTCHTHFVQRVACCWTSRSRMSTTEQRALTPSPHSCTHGQGAQSHRTRGPLVRARAEDRLRPRFQARGRRLAGEWSCCTPSSSFCWSRGCSGSSGPTPLARSSMCCWLSQSCCSSLGW